MEQALGSQVGVFTDGLNRLCCGRCDSAHWTFNSQFPTSTGNTVLQLSSATTWSSSLRLFALMLIGMIHFQAVETVKQIALFGPLFVRGLAIEARELPDQLVVSVHQRVPGQLHESQDVEKGRQGVEQRRLIFVGHASPRCVAEHVALDPVVVVLHGARIVQILR